MGHTVQLKLAIEFDDAQLAAYAQMHELARADGRPLMARDYVDSAQARAVEVLAASGQFAGAQITLKR